MELDELKILFRQQGTEQQQLKTAEEIGLLLGRKTRSVIDKLKRSLRVEIMACSLFTVICFIIGQTAKYDFIRVYFSVFACVCILFLPVLWFLLQKTARLSNTFLPVKSNLEFIVKILKEYIKRYFQFTMALIPLTLVMVLYLSGDKHDLKSAVTKNPSQILFILIYLIVFTISIYFFTKWYLKKLYGTYIERLEMYIKELDQ